MGLVWSIGEWFQSIDWRPDAVTAAANIAMAVLTFILAFGTWFLWRVTRRMVKGGERTAERQLRAYVFISDGAVRTDQSQFSITVVLRNFGLTPASDFSTWIDCGVYPFDNIPFPKIPKPHDQRTGTSIVGPTAEVTITTVYFPLGPIDAIRGGQSAIFAWGGADYLDAFGKRRYFTFRMRMSGVEFQMPGGGGLPWGWSLKPHPIGYEAN
jgi:hypothetical protein